MGEEKKPRFLWGSATASYQCEGAWDVDDKVESMWDRYLHENNLENGDVASDFYHHFREDIKMMAEGHQNAFRFSLSWPRIIKNREGEVNEKGLAFYNEVIDACLENGIEPFLTIYHWDLPQFLEEEGGWLNRDTCDAFEQFCRVVYKAFDGKILHWTTFNEPKWFTVSGYFNGNYPPCHQSMQELCTAGYHVMLANAMAIRAFREMGISGQVGLVASHQQYYTMDDAPEDLAAMHNADLFSNKWVDETCVTGKFPADLIEHLKADGIDLSFAKQEDLDVIRDNTVDFLGLNYYSATFVAACDEETEVVINNAGRNFTQQAMYKVKGWFKEVDNPDIPRNEWDMKIYPKGIYDMLTDYYERYRIPLYVTENGLGGYDVLKPDGTIEDDVRIDYIDAHVKELLRAKKDGADVRGYFVWSTMDLYSWKNGCEKRYGLVYVDFENDCRRIPKKSYYAYGDMIKKYQEEEEEEENV